MNASAGQAAEIYFNGTILTMNDRCPRAEALYVKGGRIAGAGSLEELVRADGRARRIDLQGHTLMPGLIDGHSHFTGLANSLGQCDLSACTDFHQLIDALRRFIARNRVPAGKWVVGTNYDHNFLQERRHPDRAILDQVSQDHPVMVIHASSHMGAVNTLGLRLQNLTGATPDPEGGRYGRTPEGQLDGYMEENAFVAFRNAMPMPGEDELFQLMNRAQEIYARHGLTTVQEGMTTLPLFQLLERARRRRVLYLDLCACPDLQSCAHLPQEFPEMAQGYRDHLKIGGYKIFLDGSPQGRTAWMLEPYAGAQDGCRGYPIKESAALRRDILTALRAGRQLLAHCNGDAAAEQYISAFEQVHREHPECALHRPVMIHAQTVHPEQLARMRPLEMSPSFFVAHTYFWGDVHIENLGMDRAAGISPAGSALRLGLPFSFHQDSPVLPPDMFLSIWCAARRRTRSGVALNPSECVDVYTGLKAATLWAAWQYGEEGEKGSLEVGKRADLIVLERNPLEIPLDELPEIRILNTLKDGRIIYGQEA